MGAAQIILRDTGDGRIEVCVMTGQCQALDMSRAVLGFLVNALGQLADVRTLGEGLARGQKVVIDKVTILQPGEAIHVSDSLGSVDADTADLN